MPRPLGLRVVRSAMEISRPVHLKSLTLRGFKSFASATTLRFEPGITAVVGPNGSGKSNVVDAVAWGPRRTGGQGTARRQDGRRHLRRNGRPGPARPAEVTLTIDNADGKLPIEYAEVSITRRMFRDGPASTRSTAKGCGCSTSRSCCRTPASAASCMSSSGKANSTPSCRARPEDRRGFIEEAAGVLKHRKRKERAVRKLEAMSANLTRGQRPDRRAASPAQTARAPGRDRPPGGRRPGRAA